MRNKLRSFLTHPFLRLSPILLLALSLRLWDLDARSIWFDEAVEFWSAKPTLSEITQLGSAYLQPPLFSYVLHFWMELGSSVIWMRFLSVLLSLGSTTGIMFWAYKNFSMNGAIFAGLLFAFLPTEIRYAQDISEYSLLVIGITWSMVFLDFALKESTWRHWILWGVFSMVAMYSHYGAAILLVSTGVVTLLRNSGYRDWDRVKKQLTVTTASFVTVIPLVIYFIPNMLDNLKSFGIQTSGFQLSQILNWFTAMDKAFLFLIIGWPSSTLPPWVARGLLILSGVLIVYVLVRKRETILHPVFLWSFVTYSAYFLLTELGVYAHGTYGFRYVLILAPLAIMVITTVFDSIWRSELRPVVFFYFAVFIVICAYSLPNRMLSDYTRVEASTWPETEDLREVYNYWSQERSGKDPTYIYYGAIPAFRYYRYAGGEEIHSLQPAWMDTCWSGFDQDICESDGVYYGVWIRALSPEGKLASIQNTFGEMPTQFWIIFSHTPAEEVKQVLDQLKSDYFIDNTYVEVGASAHLLSQR